MATKPPLSGKDTTFSSANVRDRIHKSVEDIVKAMELKECEIMAREKALEEKDRKLQLAGKELHIREKAVTAKQEEQQKKQQQLSKELNTLRQTKKADALKMEEALRRAANLQQNLDHSNDETAKLRKQLAQREEQERQRQQEPEQEHRDYNNINNSNVANQQGLSYDRDGHVDEIQQQFQQQQLFGPGPAHEEQKDHHQQQSPPEETQHFGHYPVPHPHHHRPPFGPPFGPPQQHYPPFAKYPPGPNGPRPPFPFQPHQPATFFNGFPQPPFPHGAPNHPGFPVGQSFKPNGPFMPHYPNGQEADEGDEQSLSLAPSDAEDCNDDGNTAEHWQQHQLQQSELEQLRGQFPPGSFDNSQQWDQYQNY